MSVAPSESLRAALAERLPEVPVSFCGPDAAGPWPSAEAWLVGTPARDLPLWTAARTPALRFVQRQFTGLDGFPFEAFPPAVRIAGNGGAYAPFVAEHAVALALAIAHPIREGHRRVAEGRLRPPIPNRFLIGRTALILGFGAIGRETATRLAALGLRIHALTHDGRAAPGAERTYAPADLRAAVGEADLIIECRPLTRSTKGTIDRAVLRAMRPEALFVNIARAGTVVEEDLSEHLRTHPEFRAAFDVFWHESFDRGSIPEGAALAALPNFLGTPHVAAIGPEARARAETYAVENLARFFRGESPRFVAERAEYEGM